MTPTTLWLIFALLLAVLEIFTTTFYLLAIAIGFLAGAAAAALQLNLPTQIGLSAIVALITAGLIRQWKTRHVQADSAADADDIGQRVSIESWLDETQARVHYRGSHWDATLAPQASRSDAEIWYITARHGARLEITSQKPE